MKSNAQEGEGCYDLFQSSSSSNSFDNGYLLLTGSYFIYPAELEVGNLSVESDEFQSAFEERFKHFGINEFDYFHEESGFDLVGALGVYVGKHHTDCVVMSNDDAITVVCRGSLPITTNPSNWITNFSFVSREVTEHFDSVIPNNWQEVWCHGGFWRAADSVYNQIKDRVSALRSENSRPVFLTGHSLGGALATIISLRLEADGVPVQGVHTFASPRVGDFGFENAYLNSGITHHRWVNLNDPGPMLPPESLGFAHVGEEHFINRFTLDPHGCGEYAKGLWSDLSYESRLIFPKWFEEGWQWETPEEESEDSTTDSEESESQELDDPRLQSFEFNYFDRTHFYGTPNGELWQKQKGEEIYPSKDSKVTSSEELKIETEKLRYRYKEEDPKLSFDKLSSW